ncbi:MAG: App1 family protein [Anaerolineae bacterium]
MANWREILRHIVNDVETRYDKLKYGLAQRMGWPDSIKIVPYNGYGTQDLFYLQGRVLEEQGITPATENDSLWDNLLNTYRRLESDEIPFARIVARFQEAEQEVEADEEGMFEVWLEPTHPLPVDHVWHEVEMELLEPTSEEQEGPVRATGKVFVPPAGARYVVVSDIDDTVIKMDVGNLLKAARTLFLTNARTRLPFPGVAALYRALHAGVSGNDQNPVCYLSSSPWNLYDLLADFIDINALPMGPILLRNYGITEEEILPLEHRGHKKNALRQLLDTFTDLPFILVGDSTQQDPEIYQEIAREYPERILAIYVRNVSRDLERSRAIEALAEEVVSAGSTLVLADNTLTMARHAVRQGWIEQGALGEISKAKARDETPPDPIEELLDEETGARSEAKRGPTVVLEEKSPDEISTEKIEETLERGQEETERPPTVIVEEGKGENTQDRDPT